MKITFWQFIGLLILIGVVGNLIYKLAYPDKYEEQLRKFMEPFNKPSKSTGTTASSATAANYGPSANYNGYYTQ